MLAFAHIGDLHISSSREQNTVDLLAIAAQIAAPVCIGSSLPVEGFSFVPIDRWAPSLSPSAHGRKMGSTARSSATIATPSPSTHQKARADP
jgi:hypothetical protein